MPTHSLDEILQYWKGAGIFLGRILEQKRPRLLLSCPEDSHVGEWIGKKLSAKGSRWASIDDFFILPDGPVAFRMERTASPYQAIEIFSKLVKRERPSITQVEIVDIICKRFEFYVSLDESSQLVRICELGQNSDTQIFAQDLFFQRLVPTGFLPTRFDELGLDAEDFQNLDLEVQRLYDSERRADDLRLLIEYCRVPGKVRSIPPEFDVRALDRRVNACLQQGASPLTVLDGEEDREVLAWLGPVMRASFDRVVAFSDIERLTQQLPGGSDDLRAWILFFWFSCVLGVPLSTVLKKQGLDQETFSSALTKICAKDPSAPLWTPILEVMATSVGGMRVARVNSWPKAFSKVSPGASRDRGSC